MQPDAQILWTRALQRWGALLRRGELSIGKQLAFLLVAAAARPEARLHCQLPYWLKRVGGDRDQRRLLAFEAARLLKQQRQPGLALSCLQVLGAAPAEDPDHQLLAGELERLCGHHDRAEDLLLSAYRQREHQAAAAYQLGELERSRGRFEQAATWLLRSLEEQPLNRHTHNALHYTRFRDANVLQQVVEVYRRLSHAHPDNALIHHLLSHYLLREGAVDAAAQEAQRAARMELGGRSRLLAAADQPPTPPDFLVIGVPKGGTSSLLAWLGNHPQLWVHPRKELHFFDIGWQHGCSWYCHQFPRFQPGVTLLRGEATPNYFQLPEVPERVHGLMPKARLILLLRDPLQRALSWIAHLRRHEGLEGSADVLLHNELQQLQSLDADELASSSCRWPDALLGSCYDLHLRRWQRWFPSDQLLLLSSEALFEQPERSLQRVAQFLGVSEHWSMGELRPYNQAPQPAQCLNAETHTVLKAFLDSHNALCTSHLAEGMQGRHRIG